VNITPLTDHPPPPGRRPAPPVALLIPPGAIDTTQRALRSASRSGTESLVVWAGRTDPTGGAVITHLLHPACHASADHLTVPFDERRQLADYLLANELLLLADLHTHPGPAFLSEADRARPFSIRDGVYAIVIPRFATGPAGAGWAIYETRHRDWHETTAEERFCARPH
jgi:proteasome lid subunit RPN8/RPN11